MSKRLQVIVNDAEFVEIQRAARRERLTTAEWVRQALCAARRAVPRTEARKKLQLVRAAAHHTFPTADVDQVLREIEQGHASDKSL